MTVQFVSYELFKNVLEIFTRAGAGVNTYMNMQNYNTKTNRLLLL